MQSFRTRMNSVLRRSSVSGKSDQSGSESDAPSRKSSGDKDSKRLNRKRVSFGARVRGDTADTLEHSQLAKQVVDATYASTTNADKPSLTDGKPIVAITELPLNSSAEYTKTDSPIEAAESSKDGASTHEPTEPVVLKESPKEVLEHAKEPKEEIVQSTAPASSETLPEEIAAPVQVEEPVAPVVEAPAPGEHLYDAKEAATDVWAYSKGQDASHAPSEASQNANDLEGPFNVIMHASPGRSTINIALEEPAPSFPEPTQYDTSFASTSSVPESLSMPVPRPTGQPLSAIDELHAKTHPLAEWNQKEDVNYDADEEETKPLLDNSILTENPERMLGDSILSLRTTDLKGKGRDTTPVYEALGWTEYILPDTSYYFALHVSSPMSPQHLRMPTPVATSPPTVTVVADYDLRDQAILKRVCEEMRALVKLELPNSDLMSADDGGWELWLHRPLGFQPSRLDEGRPPIVHTWVNHTRRSLAPRPYGAVGLPPKSDDDSITLVSGAQEEGNYERLLKELAYWSFIEKHPAHGMVSTNARREALEGLTWSYADRLLQSERRVAPPFTQEECQSLLRLLEGFNPLAPQQDRMISNRMIASILSRIVKQRIRSLDAAKSPKNDLSGSNNSGDKKSRHDSVAFPFRRAVLGLLSVIVCWGIPYLFLDNASAGTDPISRFKPLEGQVSNGNGVQMYYSMGESLAAAERKTNAMLYGAGVGLTAAIMIGAATTVLTLRPPLDTPARTAAFIALLCAGASLAASLISLTRMSRLSQGGPYSYATYPPSSELFFPGTQRDAESLVVLNAKPLRRALPLVLLAYSIVSLLVVVLLHNFAPKGF